MVHLELFSRRRLPIILQSEAAECGLASLAMVSSYHGYRVTLPELRRRFSISLKGTTLKTVMQIADALGLSGRPLRGELEDLRKVRTPAVLHWDLAHYVVLKRATARWVEIHDPAQGLRRYSWAEVSKHFTGVVLELQPTPNFEIRERVEQVRLSDLWSRARGFAPSIIQLALLSLVLQVLSLLAPMLNQMIIDDAITKGDVDLLVILAAGILLLLVIQAATGLLRSFISMHFGTLLSFQMSSNLLRHLLRLPLAWFEKRQMGDILSRFNSLPPIQNLFTGGLMQVGLEGVMAVITLAVMFFYSPLLSWVTIAGVLLFLVVRLVNYPALRRLSDEGIQLAAKEQSLLLETIRGARAFKLFGVEQDRHALWQNAHASTVNNNLAVQRFGMVGGLLNTLLSGVENLAVLYLGARAVIDGQITVGMLLAFQSYRSQFAGSATNLLNQFFSFRMLGLHLERLGDVIHQRPEPGIDEARMVARSFTGALELRRTSFRYADHEPWILRELDIAIQPGEFVAFVGPSGGGKSTLIKILMGLYPPVEGELLVDGLPLASFGLNSYRGHVGVVMQDDQLFAGTVADNIAFFAPETDMQWVEEVAVQAHIHADIMRMPMGYMTLVGDLGSTLSGGQRQRILLARALYRQPKILFLDEGTANLDPQSEHKVMEVVRTLPITRIVVAHRPAATVGAHRIISIEGGRAQLRQPAVASVGV